MVILITDMVIHVKNSLCGRFENLGRCAELQGLMSSELYSTVMLNLFQHPFPSRHRAALTERTLKQVQGDGSTQNYRAQNWI
jgi:hypothetical protein